ncbi:hypothetical protein [Zavarzinella formosa]|uniref:hypothetical protein n=1 Tax=Zavarzinella formosa TaxID=360055 RepID=UPI00037EB52D|nr:hypothetical protein [Zavarzinella formosa]
MDTAVSCPACSVLLRVPTELSGTAVKCTRCDKIFYLLRQDNGSFVASQHSTAVVPYKPKGVPPPLPKRRPPVDDEDDDAEDLPRTRRREVAEPPPLRKTPFITRTGAVVDCPWCQARTRVDEFSFNKPVTCRSCSRSFGAIVGDPGYIPYLCQSCGEDLQIHRSAAGKRSRCSDCGHIGVVPHEPLYVVKLPDNVQASSDDGPRQCTICARYLRNPLPICSVCQRMLGLR